MIFIFRQCETNQEPKRNERARINHNTRKKAKKQHSNNN